MVHVFYEANFCANLLAKRGADGVSVLEVLDTPPGELSPFLFVDALETPLEVSLFVLFPFVLKKI